MEQEKKYVLQWSRPNKKFVIIHICQKFSTNTIPLWPPYLNTFFVFSSYPFCVETA
jgi:hypothetical protein